MSEYREAYEASPEDVLLAKEGYVRYLAGVSYLHLPEETEDIHRIDYSTYPDRLVVESEEIMLAGLKDVIKYSNRPENRTRLTEMEERHSDAVMNIFKVVDTAFEFERDRQALLPRSITLLRPNPLRHEQIYKYICHSRYGKFTTLQLMDGVFPRTHLLGDLKDRNPLYKAVAQ